MVKLSAQLVAPCGINCGLCIRYIATLQGKNQELKMPKCMGCNPSKKKCAFIKGHCELLRLNKIKFCYERNSFPCKRLETLNRRYTSRYQTSLVNNLNEIRENGIDAWHKNQEKLWCCPSCGGIISVHTRKCHKCGYEQLK